MNISQLTTIGLTNLQAQAYALLLECGSIKPALAAKRLNITRTNAYKLLDKLVELDIAAKVESGKTFSYQPANPLALASLTARYRAEATAREEAAGSIMQDLLAAYYQHTTPLQSEIFTGNKAVVEAYRKQLALREDVYFIRTNADITAIGFDTMHEIRTTPSRYGKQRHTIMGAPTQGPINRKNHDRSNLSITWVDKQHYDAPVEWSVTDSSLLIVTYAAEPQALLLIDKTIAAAFLQLFKLLSHLLQKEPVHKEYSHRDH